MQLRKINCTLQIAPAEKAAWCVAMCYAGLAPESLLKVMLRCKACHAEERAAFHSAPRLQLRFRSSAKKTNCKETISRNPF